MIVLQTNHPSNYLMDSIIHIQNRFDKVYPQIIDCLYYLNELPN